MNRNCTGAVALALTIGTAMAAMAQTTVADSAGVAIVRNPNPASVPVAFVVDPAPRLILGAPNNDLRYEFVQTQSAVGLRDGSIAVALWREGEVRVFDSAGKYLRSLGRKGNGPGEMNTPGSIVRGRGDTVIVYDQIRHNLQIFTADGTYVRTVSRAAPVHCCLPSGKLLFTVVRRTPTRAANERSTIAVASTLSDTIQFQPDTLGFFPGHDPPLTMSAGMPATSASVGGRVATVGGVLSLPTPFGRRVQAVPLNGGFVVGDGTTYELREFQESGKLTRIIRAAAEPVAISASMRRRYESEALRDRVGAQRSNELAALRAYKYPDRSPVFRTIMTDETGRLWVEQYPIPGDTKATWAVYSATGTLLGRAELHRDHTVLWIGRDQIFTRWYDTKTGTAQIHVFRYKH